MQFEVLPDMNLGIVLGADGSIVWIFLWVAGPLSLSQYVCVNALLSRAQEA